jgi:8-oxo-dGTP pyrophosphatase MutT (NUDIX family)
MWKKVNSKTIFNHPRLTLLEDEVELPNGNVVPYLTFKHDHDGVTVICINDKEEILLQQEYSYPPNATLYQFPGGKTEEGEDAETTGRRELLEESGLNAGNLVSLGQYYTNNRRTAEKMYVFLAQDATKGQKSGGDPEEDITSQWVPIAEFKKMITQGKITNFSVLAAWTLFENKRAG